MGYTHYFPQNRPFSDMEWSQITKAFHELYESDEVQGLIQPEFECGWKDFFTHESLSGEAIGFNGFGDESCETFVLEKDPEELGEFNFCKTNDRPYDLMVTAMLIVCAGYAKGALNISSDGLVEDWQPAMDLVSKVLGNSAQVGFQGKLLEVSPFILKIKE